MDEEKVQERDKVTSMKHIEHQERTNFRKLDYWSVLRIHVYKRRKKTEGSSQENETNTEEQILGVGQLKKGNQIHRVQV